MSRNTIYYGDAGASYNPRRYLSPTTPTTDSYLYPLSPPRSATSSSPTSPRFRMPAVYLNDRHISEIHSRLPTTSSTTAPTTPDYEANESRSRRRKHHSTSVYLDGRGLNTTRAEPASPSRSLSPDRVLKRRSTGSSRRALDLETPPLASSPPRAQLHRSNTLPTQPRNVIIEPNDSYRERRRRDAAAAASSSAIPHVTPRTPYIEEPVRLSSRDLASDRERDSTRRDRAARAASRDRERERAEHQDREREERRRRRAERRAAGEEAGPSSIGSAGTSATMASSSTATMAGESAAAAAVRKELRFKDRLQAQVNRQNEEIAARARPALHQEIKSILKNGNNANKAAEVEKSAAADVKREEDERRRRRERERETAGSGSGSGSGSRRRESFSMPSPLSPSGMVNPRSAFEFDATRLRGRFDMEERAVGEGRARRTRVHHYPSDGRYTYH